MTQAIQHNPPSYLGRAFFVQYNVILLGGAALFSLASASAVPLLAGLVLEFLWLAIAPSLGSFRSWADQRQPSVPLPAAVSAAPAPRPLDGPYASRVLAFEQALASVRESLSSPQALAKLGELMPIFVRFCELHQRLTSFLTVTTEHELEAEISRLTAAAEGEQDLNVRVSLRQALSVAKRRLAHRTGVAGTERSVALKLDSIERSVGYLYSQGLTLGEFELGREIDAVLSDVSSIQGFEAESENALGPRSMPPSLAAR